MSFAVKSTCLLLSCILLLVSCEKQQSERSRPGDEAEIRSNAKGYEEAYNQKDAEKVASFWGQNATYFNPQTEEKIVGRSAIASFFKSKFQEKETPKITITIDSIEFKGPNDADEKGHVEFVYPNQPKELTEYVAEQKKENGKWTLQSVSETDVEEPVSQYEHLQGIEWLIGKWVDQSEKMDVNLDCKWDKHKNFLIEHFIVKSSDQDDLEGQLLTGWDPIQEKIRSWIFDSDGGFGEGFWSKEGKSWYLKMNSVQADGAKASSSYVYTPIDDKSFTFAVEGRDVDGEVLPNIEPIKFVKVP